MARVTVFLRCSVVSPGCVVHCQLVAPELWPLPGLTAYIPHFVERDFFDFSFSKKLWRKGFYMLEERQLKLSTDDN
jgi:hypothetical protein